MEILDKKLKQVSLANAGVSERSEFPDLQQFSFCLFFIFQ